MEDRGVQLRLMRQLLVLLLVVLTTGCHVYHENEPADVDTFRSADLPRELNKVSLPPYLIEPPDVLLVDVVNTVPKPPYRLQSLDVVAINVAGALPERPIYGNYTIEPGGRVNLGAPYGYVQVGGLTLPEAAKAIEGHLKTYLAEPEVWIVLAASSIRQQIAGEHLVGPDGTVSLGAYGDVYVAGMTREQAKQSIERHLSQFLERPEVSVDVFAYNSKVYYVIVQGAGLGDSVVRLPITGNETVLDAISMVDGLQPYSSTRIWIARPTPAEAGCDQILPVDWYAITQRADPSTNHQLMPGDRLYVAEDKYSAFDSFVAKTIAPFERIFGFTILGTEMVSRTRHFHLRRYGSY